MTQAATRETKRKLITSPDQIPDLDAMSWEEEDEFWQSHDFAEGVLESGPEVETEFYKLLGIKRSKE
jgi:hypothetical protein